MDLKIYTVRLAVEHDNVRTEAGGTINLTDEDAAPLLEVNAIQDTGTTAQSLIPATAPTDPALRLTAITEAISFIDVNNTDLWLKDGKPSTDAVIAVTGWPITALERDEAWAAKSA